MIARASLLSLVAVLAGCSSTPRQQASESTSAWQETVGTGTTTEHRTVQQGNQRILQAEHAMDPNAPDTTTEVNQGIP